VLWAGCRAGGDHSPVIATLNSHDIRLNEFEQFLASKMGHIGAAEVSDSIRSQMLDEYLKRWLVLDEAARLLLSVTTAEIEQSTQDNPQLKSSIATAAAREMARDLLVEKYYRQIVMRDVGLSRRDPAVHREEPIASDGPPRFPGARDPRSIARGSR
jgi:hypothetical protein